MEEEAQALMSDHSKRYGRKMLEFELENPHTCHVNGDGCSINGVDGHVQAWGSTLMHTNTTCKYAQKDAEWFGTNAPDITWELTVKELRELLRDARAALASLKEARAPLYKKNATDDGEWDDYPYDSVFVGPRGPKAVDILSTELTNALTWQPATALVRVGYYEMRKSDPPLVAIYCNKLLFWRWPVKVPRHPKAQGYSILDEKSTHLKK
jgi:hypothetical protein